MNESINFTKCKKEKNIFKKAILNINKLSNQIYAKVLSSLKPNLNLPLNENPKPICFTETCEGQG